MSGFLGVVQHRGDAPGRALLERMLRAVQPADAATVITLDGPAGFGLIAGAVTASPRAESMCVRDDVIVLVDGHIHPPDPEGAQGPTAPVQDASVLARAWTRWGIDLVERVDGDFAAAIYDRKSGTLHVLCDRTGQRRVYWSRAEGCVAFSTHLPALPELPWVSRGLARGHLAEYLSFRVVHAPRTLLTDVHALEPGHRLRFSALGVNIHRYHRPTYAALDTPVPREADIVPELHAAVERAVRRQLGDRDRVGVYLSGGIGSTAIVAAARAASRRLDTFTVTMAEEPSPESPFAGRVASLLQMEHHTITVSSKAIADHFEQAVASLGHPVGNASLVLQYVLAKAAAGTIDLVLTGDGADQLFGGRMLDHPAQVIRASQSFHRLPSPLRRVAARLLGGTERFRTATIPPDQVPLAEGLGGVHLFDERRRRALLLDQSLVRSTIRTDVLRPFYSDVDSDVYNAVLHAFFRSELVEDILPRVCGTGAAAGLEVGFPLLDQEVQRLAQVLPGAFKLHGLGNTMSTRWLLRSMLQGALPPALINRPDRGLPRPLDDWLAGTGRLFTEDRFAALRGDPLDLWHHTGLEAVKRGVGRHEGASHRMWALFILDTWMRQIGAT
jgi:asparagine synthase (glutamine-hydrolysing)